MARSRIYVSVKEDPIFRGIAKLCETNPMFKMELAPLCQGDFVIAQYHGLTMVCHFSDAIHDLYFRYMSKVIPAPQIPKV